MFLVWLYVDVCALLGLVVGRGPLVGGLPVRGRVLLGWAQAHPGLGPLAWADPGPYVLAEADRPPLQQAEGQLLQTHRHLPELGGQRQGAAITVLVGGGPGERRACVRTEALCLVWGERQRDTERERDNREGVRVELGRDSPYWSPVSFFVPGLKGGGAKPLGPLGLNPPKAQSSMTLSSSSLLSDSGQNTFVQRSAATWTHTASTVKYTYTHRASTVK